MDDTTAVHVINDFEELVNQAGNMPLSHKCILNVLKQLATIDLLHDNVDLALILKHFLYLNNPRVPYHLSNLYFFPHKLHFFH